MSLEEELETQISKNLQELIKQFEKYKEGLGYRKVLTCDKCINWENINGVQGQCKKYNSPMPDDPKIMKAGVYKAVQYCTSIPEEVKAEAMAKCLEMGFNPLMKPEGYDDATD